ncbi:MAG: heme ABC exporter ATP-binding protein CcmA [Sulfobacillus acidophilus]|uniref:Heme ABC exporter ATP-binding protein CcmA n=1 Tax=Sulfobacillus acidophilus TaxID=53633 RepID=A0A2T2WPA9_9FIRM|nr:MAG: heme ABC exporter ATP-binding protein CcmA [Sulfobacillus acidophilus]
MGNEVIVVCRNLEKRLGSRRILASLNLVLHRGTALAVTGGNGVGKSTLLRVIASAWGRSGGVLERFGQVVAVSGEPDVRIGYVGHQSLLYPSLTLYENLALYGRLLKLPDLGQRLNQVISQLQLTCYAHDVVGSYSRGTLQRAALARLFMSPAELWVMDEPFTGLDCGGQQIVTEMMLEAKRQGKTIVLTSHQLPEVQGIVDAVAELKGGRFARWWRVDGPAILKNEVTL